MSPDTIQTIRQLFNDIADIDHAIDNLSGGVAHLVTSAYLPPKPTLGVKRPPEIKEAHVYIAADVARELLQHMRRRVLRRLETFGLILEPEHDLIGRDRE